MLDGMKDIVIATGIATFELDNDEASDLLAHIRRDGGPHKITAETPLLEAIDDTGSRIVTWTDEGKQGTLAAIDGWLDVEGTTDIADAILELRYELMRDLKIPPYDVG
jgi:hypothetical protein